MDFDQLVEQYHQAMDEFFKGNSEPMKKILSTAEDVSLANPFGPAKRGWRQVVDTMERAASHYRAGEATSFENVAKYAAPDFAYLVEVERCRAKVGGSEDFAPVALRVTSIFRREDGVWKLAHRHADPITAIRPAESVVQR